MLEIAPKQIPTQIATAPMRETFCSFSLIPAAKDWLWKKVELSAIA
jgi:hypothetical protein